MTWLARYSIPALLAAAPIAAHAQAIAPRTPPAGPRAAFPSFSPDGRQIIYQQLAENPYDPAQLHVMNVDGSSDRQIATAPGTGPQSAWFSPDGRQIAYLSMTRGATTLPVIQLVVSQSDGGRHVVVAKNGGWFPVWSPDGRAILFVTSELPPRPGAWGVSLVNADGSSLTVLATGLPGLSSGGWSPDGGRIVFATPTASGSAIMVANHDGTGRRQVVAGPAYQSSPTWSRDGRLIAFLGSDSAPDNPLVNPGQRLFVVNVDGSSLREVVRDASGVSGMSFSPDGTRLLFAARRGGHASDIFVVSVDGSNERNLVNWPGTDEVPSWSPDGRQIVFQSSADPQGRTPHVYIMNADGTAVRLLR